MSIGTVLALIAIVGLLIYGTHQETKASSYRYKLECTERALKALMAETIILGEELGEPKKSAKKRELASAATAVAIINALNQGGTLTAWRAPNNPQVVLREMHPDTYFLRKYLEAVIKNIDDEKAEDKSLDFDALYNSNDPNVLFIARLLSNNYKKDIKPAYDKVRVKY